MNVPKYIWVMLICTGGYLTIEIPYSMHLVSVLGGQPTQADIDIIEKVGRLLTGIAIALAYVGVFVYPNHYKNGVTFSRATRSALFRGIPVVLVVFGALHVYGETRSLVASGEERKNAYISTLAKRSLAEQGIQGITPSDSPSWLGLVSGLPAIYSSSKLVEMTGKNVGQLAMQEARRSLGDVDSQYKNFIAILERDAGGAYRDFKDGTQRYKKAVSKVNSEADKQWSEYRAKLTRKYGNKMPRIGGWDHSWAIKSLRRKGLPVGDRFRLDDKATFMKLLKNEAMKEVSAKYNRRMELSLKGARLHPDANQQTFFSNPVVQQKIREKMFRVSLPDGVIISPDMSFDVFASRVYPNLVNDAYVSLLKDAKRDVHSFSTSVMKDVSNASMKATSLPATALLLSIAGALFHIYKFGGYVFSVFGHMSRVGFLSSNALKHIFAAVVLVFSVGSMRDDTMTSNLINQADTGIYGVIMTEAVNLQPGMFTVGEIMGSSGIWSFVSDSLPAPRFVASIDNSITASISNEPKLKLAPLRSSLSVDNGLGLPVRQIPIPVPRS